MKHLLFRVEYLFVMFVAVVAIGCAQVGLETPRSTEDSLQYGRSVASAAYKTIGDLKAANAITAPEGITYFRRVETAEHGLDTADTLLKGGKPVDAQTAVTLALNSLLVIRDELAKRTPPK